MSTVISAESTTDGWRGRPRLAWAEREVLTQAVRVGLRLGDSGVVVIGYDSRGGSREMAVLAARALTGLGVACAMSTAISPTPAVGRYVAGSSGVSGGLIFTASHNPPGDVGVKARDADGLPMIRPALGEEPARLESLLESVATGGLAIVDDIGPTYRREVVEPFLAAAAEFAGEVVFDAMYGATGAVTQAGDGVRWRRSEPAPFFFGITPDPVLRAEAEPELAMAVAECGRPRSAIALMTDGDGDRLCLFTTGSGYITSTELALALLDTGLAVEQVVSTHVAESALRAAARDKLYVATDVGFKNIVQAWRLSGHRATIGVEPNGGIAVAGSRAEYFERDGIDVGALLLRHFPTVAKLDEAIRVVRTARAFEPRQFGVTTALEEVRHGLLERWPGAGVREIAGITELTWPSGWRVLIRRSGTEDLVRCYVEGASELLDWFQSSAGGRSAAALAVNRDGDGR